MKTGIHRSGPEHGPEQACSCAQENFGKGRLSWPGPNSPAQADPPGEDAGIHHSHCFNRSFSNSEKNGKGLVSRTWCGESGAAAWLSGCGAAGARSPDPSGPCSASTPGLGAGPP